MAFKMSVKLDQVNVTIPDAYVRIEDVRLNRFEDGMSCMARCYEGNPAGSQMAAFKDIPFTVDYDRNGGDAYAQAYAGAKQLEQFAGAVDVLEAARVEEPPAAEPAPVDDAEATAKRVASIPAGRLG